VTYDANRALAQVYARLTTLGYLPIPNKFKRPLHRAWNSPQARARAQARGSLRLHDNVETIGVIVADGLGVLDIDVDDALVDRVLEAIDDVVPDLSYRAPMRYGISNFKCALFVRIEGEPFTHKKTWRFIKPGEDFNVSKGHIVEMFGGGLTSDGKYSRQFGVYGEHSNVGDYCWSDSAPQLDQLALDQLPVVTVAQADAIVNVAHQVMVEAGWTPKIPGRGTPGVEAGQRTIADREQVLAEIGARDDCGWHDEMRDYCAALAGQGLTEEEIQARAGGFARGGEDDPDLVELAHSATAKYGRTFVDTAVVGAGIAALAAGHPQAAAQIPPTVPNWVHRNSRGPISSVANVTMALEAIGIKLTKNRFKELVSLECGAARRLAGISNVDDECIQLLRSELQRAFGLEFDTSDVQNAVTVMAFDNGFDPILDMLAEAEASWDGKPRLDRVAYDYFRCETIPINAVFMRKTLVAAVARARVPGIKFDTCTVLEGTQGFGKSTGWEIMAGSDYFSDEKLVGKDSKQVMEGLHAVWMHENAEMAGYTRADIDTVKAYMSRTSDRCRPAYGRHTVVRPRRSIEVGSINGDKYLLSADGNRRFWGMQVLEEIDLDGLRRDRLQIWGEAAAAQSAGEDLTLDRKWWPVAAEIQEARRITDTWEDLVASLVRVPSSGPMTGLADPRSNAIIHVQGEYEVVTTLSIQRLFFGSNLAAANLGTSKRLSTAMRYAGWTNDRVKLPGEPQVNGYRRRLKERGSGESTDPSNPSVIPFKKPE
jgi:hypothetical protein